MAVIKVTNLTKDFDNFKAVDGINFEVAKNHLVGFLGPNGAGKTTTLRMLVGLSKPTNGRIEIAGKEIVFGSSENNIVFGYLPEQPSFYSWMTGLEYLSFVADIFAITDKDALIKKLLKQVNLTAFGKKRIGTYSNGMKQRLGIAQALINDPKVLIMDEPVSALDPIGRREVLNVLEDLKREKTILISTHILSDVDKICDDVIIINKGKIIVESPISELKEKFTSQILDIEFSSDPEVLLKDLAKESWVTKHEKNGNHLRVWPKDEKVVQQNLPLKFLLKYDIGILKYGITLPEVEDLFVSLVEEKNVSNT